MGNPGPAYEKTRHNVGFWFVDHLANEFNIKFKKPFFKNYFIAEQSFGEHSLIIIKPLTFMNLSGSAIFSALAKAQAAVENLLVIVDQMDLEPGRSKLKIKGSNAGHNGLKSVESWLETTEYKRLYLGIGRPNESSVVDHVLGMPSDPDFQVIQARILRDSELLLKVFTQGWDRVMNEINSSS